MFEGMHSPQSSAIPPLGWNGAMQVEDVPWNTNGYRHLAQDQRLKSHLEVFRRREADSSCVCIPQLNLRTRRLQLGCLGGA